MTLKDLMMLYGVTLSERRTKKQKYLFATQIKEKANELGLPFEVVEHRMGRYIVENIMVGNPKGSDYIVVAPYDTPTKSTIKCNYYPFHQALTIKEERVDLVVTAIISLIFVGIAYLGFFLAKGRIAYYVCAAIALLVAIIVLFARGNRLNFNRYSAAVAVAMMVLEDAKKKNVCVVLCDKVAKGYDGYRLLREHINLQSKVVVLDCVATGDKLVVAHGKNSSDEAEFFTKKLSCIDKCYNSEQMEKNVFSVLPECLFITSGQIKKGELVVENTRSKNDVKLDMNRLELIEKTICEYINK